MHLILFGVFCLGASWMGVLVEVLVDPFRWSGGGPAFRVAFLAVLSVYVASLARPIVRRIHGFVDRVEGALERGSMVDRGE